MAPYSLIRVREDALLMCDQLHEQRERKLVDELRQMKNRSANSSSASNQELRAMWTLEAKLEAQFAYMRRLMRTEGFVMRAMSDFDGFDLNANDSLDPEELQAFIKKRDGAMATQSLEKKTRELRQEVDIDGDGKISRPEWLLYLTNLHWQVFQEDNVAEKMVEHITEFRTNAFGQKTTIAESVVEHPAVPRSDAKGRDPRNLQHNATASLQEGMFGGTIGPGGVPLQQNNPNLNGSYSGWGGGYDIYEMGNLSSNKCCCLPGYGYGSAIGSGYGAGATIF